MPNLPFLVFIAKLEYEAQKLVKNEKVASVMQHPTCFVAMQLNTDPILGATLKETPENMSPQSDS